MKIDVTVATLNSSNTLFNCLKSIQLYIPYRKIVVVDGGSVDDTLEVCQGFNAEIISAPGASLGETRYLQALHCETKWLIYIDSDVYVTKEWWPIVSQRIADDTGLVNSRCAQKCSSIEYKRFFEYCWRKRQPRINVSFSNSLTRRELILANTEIRRVHAGEDAVYFNYLKRLGLKIVTVPSQLAYHDRDIYLHHPFAYYRMGLSENTPKTHIPRIFYRKTAEWVKYSRDTRKISIRLLKYLMKLCVCRSSGMLCSKF